MSLEVHDFSSIAPVYSSTIDREPSVNVNIAVLNQITESLNRLVQTAEVRPSPQPRVAMAQQAFIMPYPLVDIRDHFLMSYSYFDNTIELEDGSFWKVNGFDMHKLRSWASNDVLTIIPNSWPFSGEYKITNRTTGDSIAADLFIGPIAFGPSTHWIVSIDPWLNRVYLENGTYWDVRSLDSHLLSQWALNDTVILGRGGNEWFGFHDSTLINVNMNQHAYANQGI